MNSRKRNRIVHFLLILLIICLPVLLYLNSLPGTPLWEDRALILDNRFIRNAEGVASIFKPSFWTSYQLTTYKDYRPVSFSTFIIDNTLFGGSARIYRAGNIVLYAVIVLLLYFFINLLASSKRVALAAALLFATHPVHVEAVVWLKNRAELLATLFMLISLIAFIKMCASDKKRTALLSASLAACLIALLSKESSLILPLILCAIFFFLWREKYTNAKASILAPYFILSAGFFLFKKLVIPAGRMADAPTYLPAPYSHTAIAVKTIGHYLRLLFLPTDLSIHHVSASIGQAMDWTFLLSLVLIFIAMLALILSLRLHRLLALSLSWIAICLLPISNVFFILSGRPVAEQRLFFPSIGLSLALACFLLPKGAKKARWVVLIGIIACYSVLTLCRNGDWSDKRKLLKQTLIASPESWKAALNLADMSFNEGDYPAAFAYARMTGAQYPNLTEPYRHIAAYYGKLGHLKKAKHYYELALKIDQEDFLAHNGLGTIYSKAGNYRRARQEYRLALPHWPQPAPIIANIGWTYEQEGSLEKALHCYREAIKRYPDHKKAYCDSGRALYKMGKLDEGWKEFTEALEIDVEYAPAHRGLGEIAMAREQYDRAREHFERALALSPENAEILKSIAVSYKKEGDLHTAFTYHKMALLSDPADSAYLEPFLDNYQMTGDPSLKDQVGTTVIEAARRCLALGHSTTAKTYLEALLQVDHENIEARKMIMELYSREETVY